jgi:coenzyme PQQ precursor peptide PqqA
MWWTASAPICYPVRVGTIVDPMFSRSEKERRRDPMAWTRPKLREICIGMEINGYFAGTL